MSSKIFIVYGCLLIFTNILFSRISPQMSDFLCGCEYCETVDRHSPLNVGYHFSRCYSWKDSWAKSRQAMIDSQKPDVGIPVKDTLPDHSRKIFGENNNDDNSNNIHKKDTTLKEPWPFYADGKPIYLSNGDAIIYKGCEVEHWREPMKGTKKDYHHQLFLHYMT